MTEETESLDDPTSSPTKIAVATLKEKLEDPSRKSEAESLYGSGGDELIMTFSADALNENPEWGEDPDEEAEIASHQLELAQKYIEMNMWCRPPLRFWIVFQFLLTKRVPKVLVH